MKRLFAVATMITLLVLSFGSAVKSTFAAIEHSYYYGFDESVKPWQAGASDGLVDKNTLTLQFEQGINIKPNPANRYALLSNKDGNRVWMLNNYKSNAGKLRIEFLAKGITGCQACVPVVYAGRISPTNVSRFTPDYQGLNTEWRYYGFDLAVEEGLTAGADNLFVAIGFVNLDTGYGSTQQIAIDNLHITLFDY